MSRADTFETNRSRLFAVAYRMLGSVAEAEDVVQDAWLRFDAHDGVTIENPAAWLTTVTTRLAIDKLRSARMTREHYVGPWLPEPIVTDDPADHAVLAESISLAFLTMLERLDPVERAAFLLREVFALPYAEIGATLDRSEAGCRQIVHRAKERLDPDRPVRYQPSPEEEQRLLDGFQLALFTGDVDLLSSLLAEDVIAWSDGGASRRAARRPILGRERVVPYLLNLAKRYLDPTVALGLEMVPLNGDPGVIISVDGEVELAMTIELGPSGVVALRSVLNPRKLDHLRGDVTPQE